MSIKVAYLVGRFPVLYERALLAEIAGCAGEGVDARVVAFHASGEELPGEFASLRSRIHHLDVARDMGRVVSGLAGVGVGIGFTFCSPRLACACANYAGGGGPNLFARRARLARLLEEMMPGVVHAQFGHLGLCFLPVFEPTGIPLVVSFRGQDVRIVADAKARARRNLFDRAARVLARSDAMRSDLRAMGCDAAKIDVLPSGIDLNDIPFSERSPPERPDDVVILMAGRLVEKKGMADGLRAVAPCGPGASGPRVRIAGEGPERKALESLAERLGIAARVAFLGAIGRDELIREMAAAHVFMLPCRTAADGEKEGIPNAIKEAQAAGLPVISTRHAGIPECVENERSGLLTDEGDVDAMAAALDRLLADPGARAAMGRRGRAIVEERYDIRTLVPRLIEHYHAVV